MGVGAKKKGYIKNKTTGEVKSFLFNPEGFSDSKAVVFSEISSPGSSYPKFQYVKTGARSLSLDLFLNSTKTGSVPDFINFIEKFIPSGSKFNKPPVLIFSMGSDVRECILTQVDRTFTQFDKDLNVIQANITLALIQLS